jgi:hypothetical protein
MGKGRTNLGRGAVEDDRRRRYVAVSGPDDALDEVEASLRGETSGEGCGRGEASEGEESEGREASKGEHPEERGASRSRWTRVVERSGLLQRWMQRRREASRLAHGSASGTGWSRLGTHKS